MDLSYYSKSLDGGISQAERDPYQLEHKLPDFALWLVKSAMKDWQQAVPGTHLFFNFTEGAIILEIKAPERLYRQYKEENWQVEEGQ